jgi:hypothetical protein
MEHEGSLPHSQVPATCLYPEPAQFSPYPHILLLEDPCGKAVSVTNSDCVFVALGIEHAMCMRHIVISSLSALPHFPTLPCKKNKIFGKKVTEHKIRVIVFSTTFV